MPWGSDDVYTTVAGMKQQGVAFQGTIKAHGDLVDRRLPAHGANLVEFEALAHPDRRHDAPEGTQRVAAAGVHIAMGPNFFVVIQRKGVHGFGDGNFRALFASIEFDQVRRRVLVDEDAHKG